MNLFDKFRRFMYGRYGMDELQKFLAVVYIAACILKRFFFGSILDAFSIVVLIIFIVRFLSKDIYIRQKENRKYLAIKDKAIGWYYNRKNGVKKTHIFRTCPHCHAKIKLPKKRGKHVCACPRCGKDFDVRVF